MDDTAEYLLVKRDLYYCPNAAGYTGIKDHAGRYTLAEAQSRAGDGVSFVHEEDAPEYTKACYADLKEEHMKGRIEALQQELREARWAAFVAGYNAGFNASAEGWNGEYPMGHERDPYWLTRREEAVAAFLAKSQ